MELTKQVKRRPSPRPVRSPPIVLIGFMGCGKSTLGQALAKVRPGAVFVDLDSCISKRARKSIPEIFTRHGEAHFRKLETAVLRANLRSGRVLAAGGGLVTIPANAQTLKRHGAVVVWVDVSWAGLWRRLQAGARGARPLLVDAMTGQARSQASVRRLWSARRAVYGRVAGVRFVVQAGEKLPSTRARLREVLDAI